MNAHSDDCDSSCEHERWVIQAKIEIPGHFIYAEAVVEKIGPDEYWLWPSFFRVPAIDKHWALRAAAALKMANPVRGTDAVYETLSDWAERVSKTLQLS